MKKQYSTFIWFMGLMGKRLPLYLAAVLVSTLGLAFERIANARIVEAIVSAAQTRETQGLLWSVAITFILFVISRFIWRFGIIHYNIEARRGVATLEKLVFSKAMRLPYAYYEQHHSADFMSRLTFDTERAGDIYSSRLRRLLAAVISSAVYLVPMFCYSWQLTLCLLGVSILSLTVNTLFTTPMKKVGTKLSKQHSVMLEKLTNILAGMELIKVFPMGKTMWADYSASNEAYYGTQVRSAKLTAALESLNALFDLTGALAFLGLGISFISQNRINLGQLTAIYTLYGSFRYVFLEIGLYLPQMMNCIANAERLHAFLQLEEETDHIFPEPNKPEQGYAVTVDNLSFSYEEALPGQKNLLEHLSFKIKENSFVALTGESGCGKSTLTKLLLGFYEPKEGQICICGKDYRGCSKKEIRDMIAYVPQEPYLYGVSIAENIAYGRSAVSPEDVPMEDIIAAAKAANAHDFIMELPKGYQTVAGERGNTLSGGEKQRIALARAVLKNAPVLLLDEATSALDSESEKLVNEAIKKVCQNHTTIMIAHRSSTIAMADEVIAIG
ncbi:ABC transporter ATP-binding protein [Lachnospiraceae bacterium MD335]|nr:ABC transporter ATP-binding protein [Lachnospiraceae bacterium MD335]